MNTKADPIAISICIALCLSASALWTEILLYSQNTLYLNNQWIISKKMAEVGVMGGDEFLISRTPIAGKILNLGAWYGSQEVIYRDSLDPTLASFHFNIPPRSFLDFTYGRNGARYFGLRISRLNSQPSITFESTLEGGFLRSAPLPLEGSLNGWHHASIEFFPQRIQLQIDTAAPIVLSLSGRPQGQIGLRAAQAGALVADFSVHTAAGETIKSTFDSAARWKMAMLSNLIFFFALGVVFVIITRRKLRHRERIIRISVVYFFALTFGGAFYAFDLNYWSKIPFSVLFHPLPSERHRLEPEYAEALRIKIFSAWYRLIGGELISREGAATRGYPETRNWTGPIYCGSDVRSQCRAITQGEVEKLESQKAKSYRVLFIGTSQTVGAGAQKLEHSFFARTHKLLVASLGPRHSLESLNVSISGSKAEILLEDYLKHYARFSPNLVVINLGVNDAPSGFNSTIDRFLAFNAQRKIKTVLINEARNGDFQANAATEMKAILKNAAKRYGVAFFSLHDYLRNPELLKSGVLWCDMVHLTSYGQDLVARWLAPKLLSVIGSQK